jgi:hypothetical protein
MATQMDDGLGVVDARDGHKFQYNVLHISVM